MNLTFFSPALKDGMSDKDKIKRGYILKDETKVILNKAETIPVNRTIVRHLSSVELIIRHNITYDI
jgi:hypothetical protein